MSLPRAATANSNCLYPAWYQDIISSTTLDNKSSIVWTRRSKVLLFLSFQRSQHTRTTRESKHLRSSLGIRFLAPYHHSARTYVWAEGETASQCILRKDLNQTSLEKGQTSNRCSIVSGIWLHRAHVSSSCKPCRLRRSAVQHRSCSTNQIKNLHLGGARAF